MYYLSRKWVMSFMIVAISSIVFASYYCGYEVSYYRNQEAYLSIKEYAILLEKENQRLYKKLRKNNK